MVVKSLILIHEHIVLHDNQLLANDKILSSNPTTASYGNQN
ncbi:MAG: hypothetical protein ACJA1H_000064 [Glaciecola sp.]|jgi:hypothetical protein